MLTPEVAIMPTTRLDTGDTVELAQMLQLLSDWLAADPAHLDASLARFIGHPRLRRRPAASRPAPLRVPPRRR
jgi:hypothetical protein